MKELSTDADDLSLFSPPLTSCSKNALSHLFRVSSSPAAHSFMSVFLLYAEGKLGSHMGASSNPGGSTSHPVTAYGLVEQSRVA